MNRTVCIFLLACCAGLAADREEQTREFHRTVTLAAGRSFRIEHSLGNVIVRTHVKPEAVIDATIRCSAERVEEARSCVDGIRIAVEETSAGAVTRTEYPEQSFRRRNLSYSVNYRLTIPDTAPLEVRNQFGEVDVADVHAGSVIRNANGRVVLTAGKGRQRLENAFGAVEVSRNDGDVSVASSNGDVRLVEVTGAIDVRDRFGRVTILKAGRGVTIDNGNGPVELTGAGGPVRVVNSFGGVTVSDVPELVVGNANGPVDARGIRGSAEIKTTFANVTFSGVGGKLVARGSNAAITGQNVGESATVETSFGRVDISGIKGEARVVAANTPIQLRGVGGQVYAKTTFAGVTVEDAAGPVTIENSNGSVSLRLRPGKDCQPVSLRTRFGPIRVWVPSGAGYDVTAHTSFGRINSSHELTVSGQMGADALKGRIGAGGCVLDLANANGNIDILK